MASNIINKSKDVNNTTISDSSEDDPSLNSTQKYSKGNLGQSPKVKSEYNEEADPDFFIHITEGIDHKKKKAHTNVSEKTQYNIIEAIIKDDRNSLEKIIKSSNAQVSDLVNFTTKELMCPIHFAVLYGSLSCFMYLLSQKASLNKTCEGLPLLHLSISRSIYLHNQELCLKMFNFIYENLPDQRRYIDRLGRTFLHLIFEYDFMEALNGKNINLEDLFMTDKNGEYVINYVYIYNSGKCFWKVAKDPFFLSDLYRNIRNKFANNKKFMSKEKFLDNLFSHQNFYIIAILVVNSTNFVNELMEDLNNLKSHYSKIDPNKTELEQRNMNSMGQNINYVINILNKICNKDLNNQKDMHFDFPQKFQEYTAIVFNDNCIKHILLPDDPIKHSNERYNMFENSDRLSCLIDEMDGIILNDRVFHFRGVNIENDYKSRSSGQGSGTDCLLFYKSDRKSTLNDILKCHDIEYIQKLKNLCEGMKNENGNSHNNKNKHENNKNNHIKIGNNNINYNLNCLNTNPLYKESIEDRSHYFFHKQLDTDTYINEYSYENIYNTTGCVFDAIDLVMKGSAKNAFALIRPPGHHSGFYGPVENPLGNSSGFCIVNNVCIGAAYAKYKYKNDIKKIAIIDFDVHHGNGTEEIVQMLKGKPFKTSISSDKMGTFINKQTKRLNWLDFDDAKNVLFVSTHLYFEDNPRLFYPYTGGLDNNTQKDDEIYPGGILNIPFGPKNNNPLEYRNIFKMKLVPRLHKFKPDLIMISAGFDGHEYEYINKGKMKLNEFDFAYITQQIQFLANKFCNGRVVSVLEGGYNVSTGLVSSFAQSAYFHARFLNSSINMFHCFDVNLTGMKRKYDIQDDQESNKSKIKAKKSDKKHDGIDDDDED